MKRRGNRDAPSYSKATPAQYVLSASACCDAWKQEGSLEESSDPDPSILSV